MREKQSNWERMESVIKWANMSTNYFARHIGLPRGENLYQIKRGNNRISSDVVDKVIAKFPSISKSWLFIGEGDMFLAEQSLSHHIPLYSANIESDIENLGMLSSKELIVPILDVGDFAMYYLGYAMGEAIPFGSIVIVSLIDVEAIVPGDEYVVVTSKFARFRIVRTFAHGDDRLRLVARDGNKYDDMIVTREDVKKVYRVVGKVIINK